MHDNDPKSQTLPSEERLVRSDFAWSIPSDQIAHQPTSRRDDSKLLVWKDHKITHSKTSDLASFVPPGTLFIVNDSKVIASRILFNIPTGASCEILLLEPCGENADETRWSALIRPLKKLSPSLEIDLGNGLFGKILKVLPTTSEETPVAEVRFNLSINDLLNWLQKHGTMPLPPYIDRKRGGEGMKSLDAERYQTVYAHSQGSVAAPTAGLHFTNDVIESLKLHGCEFANVTLHVGAGTFLPVKAQDIEHHKMHSERFFVPKDTYNKIMTAKASQRPIICVGTTSLRTLEGLYQIAQSRSDSMENLCNQWLRTDIFIRPKDKQRCYQSWFASALMTNFHQPESTLLMLVCSLIGFDTCKKIYGEAVNKNYRFFSYGDSSLLFF
jgi:S-adenosylmethionine:tRNA ribosyltransferase-isomerase